MRRFAVSFLATLVVLTCCSCLKPVEIYSVVVTSGDETRGTASGGGTFLGGSTATISATPNAGCSFTQWDDGNADNPRDITVNSNLSFTAYFLSNEIELQDGFDDEGASYALFSVSDDRQVRFGRGNLQYRASTNTWRMAEHQFDYIGSDNRKISSTYDNWIDLFGYGTSGWESGASAYQPYSSVALYSSYYPGGSWENDLTGDYAEADWAWHNAILNGGNRTHAWRTMTADEWYYLLAQRSNATLKRGNATIGDVHGLVILPDNWAPSDSCPAFIANKINWDANTYTKAEWLWMEMYGAVFLPAAGFRCFTTYYSNGVEGCYRSTTHATVDNSKGIDFTHEAIAPEYNHWLHFGFSVRPVRDN